MYDNVVNKFRWGNMNDERVYLNENNLRMTMNFRNNFARLATALLEQGKKAEARKAYEEALKNLDVDGEYRKYTEYKLDSTGS
jgi:predicted negative regulator of RcsB-dependent stress response